MRPFDAKAERSLKCYASWMDDFHCAVCEPGKQEVKADNNPFYLNNKSKDGKFRGVLWLACLSVYYIRLLELD